MGNCLRRRQPVTWVEDDDEDEHWMKTEKAEELSTRPTKVSSASSTEVRIRISKKQLDELLRQAEIKGLPTRDVMIELINMSMADQSNEIIHDQYHWKPALRSIAEEPDD